MGKKNGKKKGKSNLKAKKRMQFSRNKSQTSESRTSSKSKNSKSQKGRSGRNKNRNRILETWDHHWNEFNQKVGLRGCILRDIDGDGNCLFRAISDQLFGTEAYHLYLRDICVSYMKDNGEILQYYIDEDEMDFTEYVDFMSKQGAWGGYFELYCLSQALEVNFVIVMKDLNVIKIEHFPQDQVRTFYLGFSEDETNMIPEHYSSLRLIDNLVPRPKDLETGEPFFAKQIPLDSFQPILTNNEAKMHKEKLLNSKDGSLTVKGKKKKSRKEKLAAKKKKQEIDELENAEDEVLNQNQRTDIELKFRKFDPKLEDIMNSKLQNKL